MRSRHLARSQGVMPQASSGEMVIRASGRGAVGKGCVGQVCSPGTSVCGTGRSSTGKIGSPVSLLSRKRNPILVACATAGISRPSFLIDQRRLGGRVIIPEVVMHDLIAP